MARSWQRIQPAFAVDVLGLVSVSRHFQTLGDVVVVDDVVVVGCWRDDARIAGTDEAETAELEGLLRKC
jgi:hypothetical protein